MNRDRLPLTEATFYILLSLSSGRKHGYAIMKEIAALGEATPELSTSTLYDALGRLQEQELIVRVESEPDDGGPGLPRKAYELTELGRRTLEAEMVRLRRQVAAGQRYLGQGAQT